jgi:cold-inducible RNA-binding protein
MSKKLFVGGLPYTIDSSQLEEMFSKIGKVVSCDVIIDRETGRSKGFGFVEMENDDEADKAIEELNNTKLEERTIAVNVARPREERPGFDNRRGPRRDNRGSRRGDYR